MEKHCYRRNAILQVLDRRPVLLETQPSLAPVMQGAIASLFSFRGIFFVLLGTTLGIYVGAIPV